ncbi:MAG: saccharopine dehydrogenase NADP-binding domain-containing protein [Pseudomonadota bacterium]
MNEPQDQRQYDVIVWGASGFTGKLVVEYFQRQYGSDLSWAVAGRNQSKLEQTLAEICGDQTRPDVLIADSHDAESMADLARATKVVLTTVGPYALYGDTLVDTCVEHGTHYCDLSGEVQWMRRVIDRNQSAAEQSGAKIVHSCGFDSIPSDLGVQFLQDEAKKRHGESCQRIELLVRAMRGGGSGGTIASGLNSMREARADREVARVLAKPYSLNPEGERDGPDTWDQRSSRYSELGKVWTAPFIMGAINMRNVRRSHALLGYPWGKDFRYTESVSRGSGAGGWLKAKLMTAGMGAFFLAASFKFTRKWIVQKLLPSPGEGPSKDERENGFFKLHLIGELPGGETITAVVTGDRDPGYGSTSKMLAESAVCLARDELSAGGGVWTPAAVMGATLRDRMIKNAGLTFEIKES